MTMGNQRSAIAGNVAKRRPFSAATASAKDEHTDDQPSGKVEALRRAMLVRGGRSAVLMAVLIFCVTYALLKYWFVVSGVYYDTLEKVQGCVPRNLEIVNDMLEEEYDGYMKDETCDSHVPETRGKDAGGKSKGKLLQQHRSALGKVHGDLAGDSSSSSRILHSWRNKIDAEQQSTIDRIKKGLPKIYIYEPQIDLLVKSMNFLNNINGQDTVGDGAAMADGEGEGEGDNLWSGKMLGIEVEDDLSKKDKGRPCEVFLFHDMIKRNLTGTLVSTLEEADRIYVPFAYQCRVASGITDRWYKSTGIDRLYKELKNSEIGRANRMHDVFIYSHRHYTQRTGFGLSMREILKTYEFTVLSPEVTNLSPAEVDAGASWLYKHIVVPQVPLLAWSLPDALSASHREWKFCFMGTSTLNEERRAMVEVMLSREDSLVVTACRNERMGLNRRLRKRNASTILYRHCEMCLIPLGDSLSDRRLFDAANAGCVPVVSQPLRPLPFPQAAGKKGDSGGASNPTNGRYVGGIDWESSVLRMPIADSTAIGMRGLDERLDELASMPASKMMYYRSKVLTAASKFSFSPCGGYSGLLLTLQRLNQQRWQGVSVPSDLKVLMQAGGQLPAREDTFGVAIEEDTPTDIHAGTTP